MNSGPACRCRAPAELRVERASAASPTGTTRSLPPLPSTRTGALPCDPASSRSRPAALGDAEAGGVEQLEDRAVATPRRRRLDRPRRAGPCDSSLGRNDGSRLGTRGPRRCRAGLLSRTPRRARKRRQLRTAASLREIEALPSPRWCRLARNARTRARPPPPDRTRRGRGAPRIQRGRRGTAQRVGGGPALRRQVRRKAATGSTAGEGMGARAHATVGSSSALYPQPSRTQARVVLPPRAIRSVTNGAAQVGQASATGAARASRCTSDSSRRRRTSCRACSAARRAARRSPPAGTRCPAAPAWSSCTRDSPSTR